MPDPATPTPLQKALQATNDNVLPGSANKCPSCDKAGMTLLVTLYAALPEQWYRPNESDWVQEVHWYDYNGYVADRPLKSSRYFMRRLRQGWLYVYYPTGKLWECYQVQSGGRLLRMAPDMMKAMGVGDAKCQRFATVAEAMLLTIENPEKHDQVWIGFSEARWTAKVRAAVAKDPASAHMKKITPKALSKSKFGGTLGPLGEIDADGVKGNVIGFQSRLAKQTLASEAYMRPAPEDAARICKVMEVNNAAWKLGGLLLPLEDDIGIATQLNFFRNCALADIMGNTDGKGTPYTPLERDKMVTAGLIETLPLGDHADEVKKHLDVKAYDEFLEKYHHCQDSSADFDNRSADYISWIKFTAQRGHPPLFDPADKEVAARLGTCVADMYDGCGLTKREFDEVLHQQLALDVAASGQLLWRGIAANQEDLLEMLKITKLGFTGKGLEAIKQTIEVHEQVSYLKEVRALNSEAMHLNQENAHRLLGMIGSRSSQLLKSDFKLYRQTFRRMQAIAMTADDVASLEVPVQGGVRGLIASLRKTNENAKGLSVGTSSSVYNRRLPVADLPEHAQGTGARVMSTIPKTNEDLGEYLEVLAQQWPKGKPMPPEFAKIAQVMGADSAVPVHKPLEPAAEVANFKVLKLYGAASGALGVMKLWALRQSISELGVELANMRAGDVEGLKIAKAVAEVAAPALGVWQASYEVGYVVRQIVDKGAKTPGYFRMVAVAGKLSMAVSIVEGLLSIGEARTLWNEGDTGAGFAKGASGVAGMGSGVAYYAYTRMVANAGLRAAASVASHGEAAEIAAGLATAGEAGAAGAEVSVEVPPVAMWVGVVSAGLLATSWVLDFWSSHIVTSPIQKWADRTLIGSKSNKWGAPFKSTKQQLDALLKVYYSVKVEKASMFSSNAIEVKMPMFGRSSELDVNVMAPRSKTVIGRFKMTPSELPESKKEVDLENQLKTAAGANVHAQATREDEGVSLKIWLGSAKSAESNERGNLLTNSLPPVAIWSAGSALVSGVPTAEVCYWPDRGTYPDFFVDGRSADESAESAENESDKPGGKSETGAASEDAHG